MAVAKPLALVTGATGAVGPTVVKELLQAGFSVRTLSLEQPVSLEQLDIDARRGDISNLESVQAAMRGVDSVLHLAALLHIVNPPPDLADTYYRVNVGGTVNVVQAALQEGVRRVALFSTIAVYGQSHGRILEEDSPVNPDSLYAKSKLEAEKVVLAARHRDGVPLGTVLRLSAVYGARIKGNYAALLGALSRRRFIPIGKGRNRRTLIYDRDAARAAVLAIKAPAAAGRIYNVTDGQFHLLSEIISAMCDALGRTPPRVFLPAPAIRRVAAILEYVSALLGRRPPLTRALVDKYTEDIAVDGRRIQEELDFTPEYDLARGWRATVREMGVKPV